MKNFLLMWKKKHKQWQKQIGKIERRVYIKIFNFTKRDIYAIVFAKFINEIIFIQSNSNKNRHIN